MSPCNSISYPNFFSARVAGDWCLGMLPKKLSGSSGHSSIRDTLQGTKMKGEGRNFAGEQSIEKLLFFQTFRTSYDSFFQFPLVDYSAVSEIKRTVNINARNQLTLGRFSKNNATSNENAKARGKD